MAVDPVLDNTVLLYSDDSPGKVEIAVSRQYTCPAIYYVYRDLYLSRVSSSYFPSGYTACSFSTLSFFFLLLFLLLFFYIDRNDAVELGAPRFLTCH